MQDIKKSWAQGQPSPYQQRDITHFPDWHGLIVLDAFFNNLTSGLMVCTAIAWAFGSQLLAGLVPFALTLALALLVIDLGFLIADLGDPFRFFHSMRVLRFTSPLSVGVWALTSYGVFLGIACIISWILMACEGCDGVAITVLAALMRVCTVMAIIAAVVVICYKGVVFSCSSQPGVCQARWLTPFMVADSLLMGMGVFCVLALIFAPGPAASVQLILPLIVLLIARCITYGLLWQDVKSRARKLPDEHNRIMALIVYGVGGILPLLFFFCGAFCMSLAVLLLLITGLFERNWIISLARPL